MKFSSLALLLSCSTATNGLETSGRSLLFNRASKDFGDQDAAAKQDDSSSARAPPSTYDCTEALRCTTITETTYKSPSLVPLRSRQLGDENGKCNKGPCVKEVCLEILGPDDGCPATISHMCDQANEEGCPYNGIYSDPASYWDWKDGPIAGNQCPLTTDVKCEPDVPAGKKMCQYGAPGEKLYFIVKDKSAVGDSTDFVEEGNEKCYIFNDWTPDGRVPREGDSYYDSCSGQGNLYKERVIEYTIPGDATSCPQDCPGFCGCDKWQIDLAQFNHGDWVNDVAPEDYTGSVTVTVTTFPGTGGKPGGITTDTNEARVYDTLQHFGSDPNHADPELEDPDLECAGAKKVLDSELSDYKVLIVQEDNNNGVIDSSLLPDDTENGGWIKFAFDPPVDIDDLELLDSEKQVKVVTVDTDGAKTTARSANPGNCGLTKHIVNVRNVVELKLKFPESGAVGPINFCVSEDGQNVQP